MTLFQAHVRYGQMFQVDTFFTEIEDLAHGDACVIRSERGMEVGIVLTRPDAVPANLLPEEGRREILRRVTDTDRKKLKVLDREGRTKESVFCNERIASRALQMRLTKVEHLFGGDKIVFYYTADGRVDFRGLVKDLAGEFKCKILMRQIGARDEARLLGDYNSCGQELCCTTFIKDFEPITMKMAKNQMTTLDPAKITGRCGRLMCCLRYEDDNYVEMKRQLPKKGKKARTREGIGVVVGYDVLAQRVTVALEKGGRRSFPAHEVLRLEKKSKSKKDKPTSHVYVTAPALWQQTVPDATELYSLVISDVIGRYHRMMGHEVRCPVILANYPAAVQSGQVEAAPAGEFSRQTERILDRFQILRSQLFSTGSPHHLRTVSDFCRRLLKVGDLYKESFKGWQCTRCHRSIAWDGAEREQCLHCGSHLEPVEGQCYFFKLSSYQRKLLTTIQTGEDVIKPQILKLELEGQIKRGLEDIVIARGSFRRGLSMPGDEDFQLAGWFESLLAYVSCLIDEEKNELFFQYWPAQVQLVSKDLLWTHGVLWLAMLLASKVDLPRRLIVHGEWRGSAEPGNLSASGSYVALSEPIEERASGEWFELLAEEFGSDSLRYYFLREVPFGLDGEFDREHFLYEIEQELGKDLGQLVTRVFSMVEKYFDGVVPPSNEGEPDPRIKELLQEVYYEVTGNLERLQFSLVLSKLRQAWRQLAVYLDEVKPWKLAKNEQMRASLSNIIYSICESIRILAVFLWPIMPATAEALHRKLGIAGHFDFSTSIKWGGLQPGAKIDNEIEIFPYNNFLELPRLPGAERTTVRRNRR